MANRGQLTEQIQAKSRELLGREITQVELRLMPYAQYCLMNGQNIDPSRINESERWALSQWREAGWIRGGAVAFDAEKPFWDAMHEILWLGYVAHEDQPDDLPMAGTTQEESA